jgi:hypothetical protein
LIESLYECNELEAYPQHSCTDPPSSSQNVELHLFLTDMETDEPHLFLTVTETDEVQAKTNIIRKRRSRNTL